MRHLKTFALSISVPAMLAGNAVADPVTLGRSIAFLDHDGANTVGIQPGINITTVVETVVPLLGSIGTASQHGTNIPVNSLFTSTGISNSQNFAGEIGIGSGLTGPWKVSVTSILGILDTATATTNSLVGVTPLDRPTGLSVSGNTLAPTIDWTNPAGSFTRTRLEVWDDTHNVRLAEPACSAGAAVCTSITLPTGLLAPGGDYSLRVIVEDRANPSDFFTTTNRSNAFVNHTATSTARESGAVRTGQQGVGDTGQMIVSGANNLPELSVSIGRLDGIPASRGALRLVSGDSLNTAFLHAGQEAGSFGNIVLEGATVTLDGTDAFNDPPAAGGFLNVGRSGTGYVLLSDGATVQINANGHPTPGINVGRNASSFGHMVVEGSGTTVTVDGSSFAGVGFENGLIGVGRAGIGRLDILNGATVTNDPEGTTNIGVSREGIGGRGTVTVNGTGSLLDAGAVLELGDPFGNGGLGRLSVEDGGQVLADVLNIHTGGILTGDGGGIDTTVINVLGGIIAPGASPGIMTIIGDLVLTDGALILEAESASLFDHLVITGDLILDGGRIEVVLGYTPSMPLNFFDVQGNTIIGAGFGGVDVFAPIGSGVMAGTMVTVDIDGNLFHVGSEVPKTPVPATLALLAPAMAAAGLTRLRRRKGGAAGLGGPPSPAVRAS